jgi:hypothetical protein
MLRCWPDWFWWAVFVVVFFATEPLRDPKDPMNGPEMRAVVYFAMFVAIPGLFIYFEFWERKQEKKRQKMLDEISAMQRAMRNREPYHPG